MAKKPADNSYLKYIGLGAQLVSYVLLMSLLGYKLDEWTETSKPWWLMTCALLGCVFAILHLIKLTLKK